jgi:hypothetical protein
VKARERADWRLVRLETADFRVRGAKGSTFLSFVHGGMFDFWGVSLHHSLGGRPLWLVVHGHKK